LAGLQAQAALYQDTARALSDAETTTLVLVTRPENSALKEADRTRAELSDLGVHNQQLVINGVFQRAAEDDPVAIAMQQRAADAIRAIPDTLADLPRTTIPLAPRGVLGTQSLRLLGTGQVEPTSQSPAGDTDDPVAALSLGALVDQLAEAERGVILAMGKGGVGKTTIAAAIATALAERGHGVHLTTTDPAAHLSATIAGDQLPGLTVDRIDPAAETAAYSRQVLTTAGSGLDAHGRALLEEDLRSPCTEEIAVFRAFAKAVAAGKDRFVVLDTAPTGHTILLLDSALAYHREVTRQASQMPEAVEQLLPRLRDPGFTRVLIVTLPEATPVHEAAQLQDDLRRAEITPYAWLINQSLTPLAVTDPRLRLRRLHERPYLREVIQQLTARTVIIPWQADPPRGRESLNRLAATASS
jgi:arsenite-transporting ATPase